MARLTRPQLYACQSDAKSARQGMKSALTMIMCSSMNCLPLSLSNNPYHLTLWDMGYKARIYYSFDLLFHVINASLYVGHIYFKVHTKTRFQSVGMITNLMSPDKHIWKSEKEISNFPSV